MSSWAVGAGGALLVAALLWPGPAGAQSSRRREPGVLGGGEDTAGGTAEVDACAPPFGDEDERVARAAEHYDRGLALYEQGDYENAVPEFVAAYCDQPAAQMLLAIGQAFERQVNYEKAVAYLDRYILEAPEGARDRERQSYRVAVLRDLPARIRVATSPPGATVTMTGPTGLAAREEANASRPMVVRQGTYTLDVTLPGHEPVSETVVAEIGQPYSYFFRLEPQRGTVRVFASPANARIFVDQRLAGLGSYVDTVPIGPHQITVEAEGRQPVSRDVEVAVGRTADVRIQLPDRPRSGRRELLIGATIGGGLVGGSVIGGVFKQDSQASTVSTFAGLAVGFGGAYFGIPDDISVGTSSYLIGATLIGLTEGMLVSSTLACDRTEVIDEGSTQPRIDEECPPNIITGVGLVSAIGGAVFAALTTDSFNLDAGDAALVNSGAMWGTAAGALFWTAFDSDPRIRGPLLLVGLNLGLLAGGTLAARSQVSRGHVALIDLAGLGGGVAGVALASAFETGDATERTSHFALGGVATGLIAGAYLTRNMDEARSTPRVTPVVSGTTDSAGHGLPVLGAKLKF